MGNGRRCKDPITIPLLELKIYNKNSRRLKHQVIAEIVISTCLLLGLLIVLIVELAMWQGLRPVVYGIIFGAMVIVVLMHASMPLHLSLFVVYVEFLLHP